MVTYGLFFAKCRDSLVRAFKKKTPISVRRCGGGEAKGGTERVRSFVTFLSGWTPLAVPQFLVIQLKIQCGEEREPL